ncbi:MAG: CcmD family protein [Candidatus Latescibacterota bacterium]|jgi:CcmD family protein|tara:strand:- start:2893 stop:3054 length:162 start_codon:yes stop_codon:yes gene_type:complete
MEKLQYLFAAYAAIWIILFAYVMRLQNQAKMLGEELERLGEDLGGTTSPSTDE